MTVGSSLLAVGSTEEKAVSRAVGNRDDSATAAHKILPIAGCVSAAVAHDGKMHVMSVSFPSTPGLPAQYFSFRTPIARDAFMRALQAKSAAAHDRAAAAARAEDERKATSAHNAAAAAVAHALQSIVVQDVIDAFTVSLQANSAALAAQSLPAAAASCAAAAFPLTATVAENLSGANIEKPHAAAASGVSGAAAVPSAPPIDDDSNDALSFAAPAMVAPPPPLASPAMVSKQSQQEFAPIYPVPVSLAPPPMSQLQNHQVQRSRAQTHIVMSLYSCY